MFEVTQIPYDSFQPPRLEWDGSPARFIAKSASAIGIDKVALGGGTFPGVVTLGIDGAELRAFAEDEYSTNFHDELDDNRVIRLYGDSDQVLRASIFSTSTGRAKHTAVNVPSDVYQQEGLPAFVLQDGHPATPHTNDRWYLFPDAWMTSPTQAYTVQWIDAGAYQETSNYSAYFVYLIPFTLVDDVELGSVGTLIQLAGENTWLAGHAFNLTDTSFFVQERMNAARDTGWAAPSGYRDQRTYLRAYAYSGDLLARSAPIGQMDVGNDSPYLECTRGSDGTIITTNRQDYDDQSWELEVYRHEFTGSAFTELARVSLDTTPNIGGTTGTITPVTEFAPGRFFVDYLRRTPAIALERVMRVLDYDFNTIEEYIFDGDQDYNQDWWSVMTPGHFGMAGHNTYDANSNLVGEAYLVQHTMGPFLRGQVKDAGRQFIGARKF